MVQTDMFSRNGILLVQNWLTKKTNITNKILRAMIIPKACPESFGGGGGGGGKKKKKNPGFKN